MIDIGRVVVPPEVPDGFALFYTTTDFPGRLTAGASEALMTFVRERFGVEATLATCAQIHSANVVRAAEGEQPSCDALWSDRPHTALGIKVADCLPVTLIDPAHGVLANIHSGWRGTVQRITGITLDTLARDSAFDPAEARAWLGPAIRVCCFEVGEEVVEQFRAVYPNADAFIDRTRGTKAHIDTAALTRATLEARGIARIVDVGLCTKCDEGVGEWLSCSVTGQASNSEGVSELPGSPVTGQPSNAAPSVQPPGNDVRAPLFHSYRRASTGGGRNLAIVAR